MKILIDTNVIIDALTSREPWNKSAEKIFIMAANNIVDNSQFGNGHLLFGKKTST